MYRPTVAYGYLVVLSLFVAPTARAQCNGTFGPLRHYPDPITEKRTCPTLERNVDYRVSGQMVCNDPNVSSTHSGEATVFVDARGACHDVSPMWTCDYTIEGTWAYMPSGDEGLTLEAAWNDGVRVGDGCTYPDQYKKDTTDQVNHCYVNFCCDRARCNYVWVDQACQCALSPLFLVFEGPWQNALTSAEKGVPFALLAGGERQLVAWTHADTERVGLLARDRNGNQTIDDGSELYGSGTPQITTPGSSRHGFSALATEDFDLNGLIDAHDPAYAEMVLWFDRNHNGYSEPQELLPLATLGITAIDLRYRTNWQVDRHGNRFAYESDVVIVSKGRTRIARVYDVLPKTTSLVAAAGK